MRVSAEFLKQLFNIDTIETFTELFNQAEKELLPKPAGSKIARMKEHDSCDSLDENEHAIATPSSFLRLEGLPHIVMLASGEHRVLGEGASGKVKLAINKEGNLYAVKIFTPPRSFIQREQIQEIQEEHNRLMELQMAPGPSFFSQKKGRVKLYSVQYYCGQSLDSVLKENQNLSFKTRTFIAIALCLKLHHLHTGELSQANIPYVHFDLKPQNITLQMLSELQVRLHLVDFGSARVLVEPLTSNTSVRRQKGSLIYLPVDLIHMADRATISDRAFAFQKAMGMRACDLIALKRIINFHPELLTYYPGGCSIFRAEDLEKLSSEMQQLLSNRELNSTAPDENALFIAAALANELTPAHEKYALPLLKENPQLQLSLVQRMTTVEMPKQLETECSSMQMPLA